MELEPEEKALVESYLRTSTDTHRRWLLEMVAGALSCVAAVFFLLLGLKPSIALLGFVLGLVVMARGMLGSCNSQHVWSGAVRSNTVEIKVPRSEPADVSGGQPAKQGRPGPAPIAPASPPADRSEFVNLMAAQLERRRINITERQEEALWDAHPVLLIACKDEVLSQYFWAMVRNPTQEKTGWEKARQMILRGQVMSVSQAHSLRVGLTTRDGRIHTTEERKIDDVRRLVREVDPKGVLIGFATE